MQHELNQTNSAGPKTFWSRTNIVFACFFVIAGFYLITEHQAHVFGYLPIVLLLACPLLHVFMHGGHSHGETPGDQSKSPGQDSNHHH